MICSSRGPFAALARAAARFSSLGVLGMMHIHGAFRCSATRFLRCPSRNAKHSVLVDLNRRAEFAGVGGINVNRKCRAAWVRAEAIDDECCPNSNIR